MFKNEIQNFDFIQNERPSFDSTIPECIRKLIADCWAEDPEIRPTFDYILDRLEKDKEFIYNSIDENEFLDYVDLMKAKEKQYKEEKDKEEEDKEEDKDKEEKQYEEEDKEEEKDKEKQYKEEKDKEEEDKKEEVQNEAEIISAQIESQISLWKDLGSIVFITPELEPFSVVGDLSKMVWCLAKELSRIGLDIHCISPYYNRNREGETDYLKKYGIQYLKNIDIFIPNKVTLRVHYGIVDGVKCWFIHHFTYFDLPYQFKNNDFTVAVLVAIAKGSLELICQFFKKMPRLIISNDWLTGFIPAFAKHFFGGVFDSTMFTHVIHCLEYGYTGKFHLKKKSIKKNIFLRMGILFKDVLEDVVPQSYKKMINLPRKLYFDDSDETIDPTHCALISCNQWATISKRYHDDLLESSIYSDLLKRFREPFACSTGIDII